jgi:cytoskeletal protein RodZ
VSVGDALAEARSQAGLTIAQVSQRTCIRETIIRGIERGDFSACGGDFYARGHIRSIARAVGLDPEELIREYDAAHGTPHTISAADVFEPATPIRLKERRSPNWSIAMVLVLAVVLGYGVYRVVESGAPAHGVAATASHPPVQASHTPSTQPASTPSASATPSSSSHNWVIQLTAIQDCWVEFTKPDGSYLSQAYIVGGTVKTWTFHRAVDMRIGNPGGIRLTVNGRDLGEPGTQGQPVTLSFAPGQKLPSQTG